MRSNTLRPAARPARRGSAYHPDVPDFPTLTRGWTSTTSVEIPPGVNFVDRWDPRVADVPAPTSRFAYA
ncbi:hypothetical protein ACXC9Q_14540 [Kribbella sp. CWNU-51]